MARTIALPLPVSDLARGLSPLIPISLVATAIELPILGTGVDRALPASVTDPA
jgi:hypothetical protein